MRDVTKITAFAVIKEGGSTYQRNFSPKHAFHDIVGVEMEVRPGNIHIALHTDAFFSLLQGVSAYRAPAWEKQSDKRHKPSFKHIFHFLEIQSAGMSQTGMPTYYAVELLLPTVRAGDAEVRWWL